MLNAIALCTEYLTNPMGIDITKPRFFWKLSGEGQYQTAYQVLVHNDRDELLWDSGRVKSSCFTGIAYAGKPLGSRVSCRWKVQVWDESDVAGAWSEEAFFELGLLHKNDWQAVWITGAYKPVKNKRYSVDCFKKRFKAKDGLLKARLYITACGLYETCLNGQRIGEHIFAPGYTDYRKRIQYQTYDITKMLQGGENTWTIELADGWYRGSIGAMGVRNFFGKQTMFMAQMALVYGDHTEYVVTDDSFGWCNDGPIVFADMKDGEKTDLRKVPSFSKKPWQVQGQTIVPLASNNVITKEQEHLTPVIIKSPSGKSLLDFGQNIAGYVEINISARDGQRIYMQFAEHLNDNGELDMASMQCKVGKEDVTPKQEIRVICHEGDNHYKTKFAVFGFRYACVVSDMKLMPENVTAIAVYSDMAQTGHFQCSNPWINRFVENTRWSMKGNFLDVPTDCPTRERAGWTGDAQIFCKTGTYLMDTAAFFRKWLKDLQDRQCSNGKVHCIVPTVGNELYISRMDGCCGWADAAVLVPARLSEIYGDDTFLHDAYTSMREHTLFQISRTNKTGLFGRPFRGADKKYISNVGQAFGEWLEPPEIYKQSILKDMIAPHPEEATAYLSYICGMMAEISKRLGHLEDTRLFEEYRDGCKKAYNHQFVINHDICTRRQSKLVRPLALGLLEGKTFENVSKRLADTIRENHYHIGTGFLSTPLILPLLTQLGYIDLAYQMMENEERPGWLFEVISGATTVWENWDGSASQNHYSPGSVCQWLFEDVCGIHVAGENTFYLTPKPGGTLSFASFEYDSIYGKVYSRWDREADGDYSYEIHVPAGCSAQVEFMDRSQQVLTAGIHKLICKSERMKANEKATC